MRKYGFIAFLTLAAAGQQQQPPPTAAAAAAATADGAAEAPNVTFTSNSNLVIVDVTVKDPKTGKPIEGLKPSDFTLDRRRQAAEDLHV